MHCEREDRYGFPHIEHTVLVRVWLRLWRCRTTGRGRIHVRLVVYVEHVDARLAAVPEVRDRVAGGERAEVDVALCGRPPAQRECSCGAGHRHDHHEILPPATITVRILGV